MNKTFDPSDYLEKFEKEYKECLEHTQKMLRYLANSYFGSEEDLINLRQVYREWVDMSIYFNDKVDYYHMGMIQSFLNLLKYMIEMYENQS